MFIDPRSKEAGADAGTPSEIEQLRTLLYTDDLTGLYNRRFFRHCCAEQKSQADSSGSSFALLMMDIDHFKTINDTYGHAVGDQTLIKIAGVLQQEIKEKGWVFRYAGDEFVALIRNPHDAHLPAFCARLLDQVANSVQDQQNKLPVKALTLSIGYARYPADSNNVSELMKLADHALYSAKNEGRNSFQAAHSVLQKEKEAASWPVEVECQSLIAREQQWSALQHYYAECKSGKGKVLFITGGAGIGKSRLIKHFFRRQRAADHHYLFGQCSEGTLIHSFGPIRDALRRGFEAKDPATANIYKQLNEQYRCELVSLVPQFERFEKGPLRCNPSGDRYVLLESILLLLQGLSRQLATIVILEDIHWSDEASINLLQFLGRHTITERLLLIATFREEEAISTGLPAMLENMSRENLFEVVSLQPFNQQETLRMVQEIFGEFQVSEELHDWIYSESEGIPFYVEELIKLLLDEKRLEPSDNRIVFRRPEKFFMPYSIRALIHRRTNRLDEKLKRILGYASIIGYEFGLNILARLIEENEGYLLDLLETLTRMQIIRELPGNEEEHFAFTHNKIRDVIYEDLGLIKRRKFHNRVGEIIEELHQDELPLYIEELAYHYEQAGNNIKAIDYSLEAGKKGLQIHAYRDALKLFERCRELTMTDPLLSSWSIDKYCDLHRNQARTLEALGSHREAIASLDALLRQKTKQIPVRIQVDVLNDICRLYCNCDQFEQAEAVANQALEVAREHECREGILSACQSLGKTFWHMSRNSQALECMQTALKLVSEEAEPDQKSSLLNATGVLFMEEHDYSSALECFERALEISRAREQKTGMVESLVNIGIIRHHQGDLHEARQHMVNAAALAQEISDPFRIAACQVNQAEVEWKLANYELSRRLNDRAYRTYQELNHEIGQTHCKENEANLLLVKNRLDKALAAVDEGRSITVRRHASRRTLDLLKLQARVHYFRGSFVSSFRALDTAAQIAATIEDEVSSEEIEWKRGFGYLALGDTRKAGKLWSKANTSTRPGSAEHVFWRSAVAAFLAAFNNDEAAVFSAQREMRLLSEKSANSYLITSSSLLCSVQYEMMGRLNGAMKAAKEAEKSSLHFAQDLWLLRARVKIEELRHKLGEPADVEIIRQLLDASTMHGQREAANRCFQLLARSKQLNQSMRGMWKSMLAQWQNELPDPYHARFLILTS